MNQKFWKFEMRKCVHKILIQLKIFQIKLINFYMHLIQYVRFLLWDKFLFPFRYLALHESKNWKIIIIFINLYFLYVNIAFVLFALKYMLLYSLIWLNLLSYTHQLDQIEISNCIDLGKNVLYLKRETTNIFFSSRKSSLWCIETLRKN